MDKFTYMTTYKQDFCMRRSLPGNNFRNNNNNKVTIDSNDKSVIEPVEEVDVNCRGIFVPGVATGLPLDPKILGACSCQAGGLLPPRGAFARGLPTNLEKKCMCFTCDNCFRPPIKTKHTQKKHPNDEKKKIHLKMEGQNQMSHTGTVGQTTDVVPKTVFVNETKTQAEKPKLPCPSLKGIRPVARGKYGGQDPPRRNQGDGGCNGPPWLRQRRDERRDPDVLRITRHPPRGDVPDVIHGEEARAREGRRASYQQEGGRRRVNVSQSEDRIPGPFWIRQRPDERREIDVTRRKKFEKYSEARDVIHGGPGPSGVGRRSSEFGYSRRRPGPGAGATAIPGPFWNRERADERREVDVLRKRKFNTHDYEVRDVIHGDPGGLGRRQSFDLASRCRRQSDTRIPGPFWMRDRPDMRREPDIARRRRIERRGVIPDVIHGEERRAQEWREARDRRAEERQQIDPYDLPPGPSHADPFWLLERADERRNPDMDKKRKFERQVIKVAEIIHGEDFRTRYDPPRREELPRVLGPDPVDETIESDEDEAEAFPFRRTCECAPGPARGMQANWDNWRMEQDEEDDLASITPDMEEAVRERPAARISCAPQAEVSSADQPNAFMKQLYRKYPYLYQVLRETPPEELASRVFKDKFLSTYQVDFLHMGVGQEQIRDGGAQVQERVTGPDGEPEPQIIPGCSYRHGERGDFGRKKQEEKKKEKEEPVQEEQDREEPRISEYMATISRLGNEIVTDQLYRVAQITKNMKNDYKKP